MPYINIQQRNKTIREKEGEIVLSRYVASEVESKTSSGVAQDMELNIYWQFKKKQTWTQNHLKWHLLTPNPESEETKISQIAPPHYHYQSLNPDSQ